MKLALRLILAVGFVLTIAFVLDAYLAIEREEALFFEDVRRDSRLVGKTLAAAMEASREGPVRTLEIADANERVTVRVVALESSAATSRLAQPAAPLDQLAALHTPRAGGSARAVEWIDPKREKLFVYVPVTSNAMDAPLVAVEISESLATLTAHRKATVRSALVRTTIATICVFAIIVGLAFLYVGGPVRELVAMARRIGRGDFSTRVPVRPSYELAELADAMNRMSEDLLVTRESLDREAQQRLEAMEQVRHSDRLATIGKLAAGLAHELGTPLTVVAGRAKDIATGELPAGESTASAQVIHDQAMRMSAIIRQLLDFSRQRHAVKASVNLHDVATQVASMLTALTTQREIELVVEDSIPAPAKVDPTQVHQIMTNLVMNAVHAVESQGRITISIDDVVPVAPAGIRPARANGSYFRISVSDTGPGIPEDVLPRVFEPFFTTKAIGEGTGLGLAVAYGLARENDGWITAENRSEGGACFSIFLPALHPASLPTTGLEE